MDKKNLTKSFLYENIQTCERGRLKNSVNESFYQILLETKNGNPKKDNQ